MVFEHGGEYRSRWEAISSIAEKIRTHNRQVLFAAQRSSAPPRTAAVEFARERVQTAAPFRRFGPRERRFR